MVRSISDSMRNWYGPPIRVGNVPGMLYATKGGDFCGKFKGGHYSNLFDYAQHKISKALRTYKLRTGFSSLSDVIAEASAGKKQCLFFQKAGTAGVVGRGSTLWNVGSYPAAGGSGGTTGTGRACTRTTTGALGQANAQGSDTLHFLNCIASASVAGQLGLLYDRIWDMTHTMTVDPRSVDAANQPTRYQSAALAAGNFLSGEVTTVLPAATPTIAFKYVDQDGNLETGAALSTIASAAAVNTVPFTAPNWFYPLNAGDTGLRYLQNDASAIDLSAAMASGVCNWFIGHPLVFIPIPAANIPIALDGVNAYISLERIYDDACLSLMEVVKSATTATTWTVNLNLLAG